MRIDCSLLVALSLADDGQDAVGVDVEGHLDLRHAARRGRDAVEEEAADRAVVPRQLALALQHADLDLRLAVRSPSRRSCCGGSGSWCCARSASSSRRRASRCRARAASRRAAARPSRRRRARHPARPRRSRPPRRGSRCGSAPCRRAPSRAAARAGCASSRRRARPRRCRTARRPASARALRQGSSVRSIRSSISCSNFARDSLSVHVLRARRVRRDERQVDVGALRGRQLDLRLLGGLAQALHRHRILREVDALVLLELGRPGSPSRAGRGCRRRGACRRWWTSPRPRCRPPRGSRCRRCRRRSRRPRSSRPSSCRGRRRARPRSAR